MAMIHVCLLCHTEGSIKDFEVGLPALLNLRDEVERGTGRKLPMTWVLGTYHRKIGGNNRPAVFEEFGITFKNLLRRGDEIGLHPHGIIDEDRKMTVDPFVGTDTRALLEAGFPEPRTFVAGTWSFYPSTLELIEQEGYRVDSSVAGGKLVQDGITIYEYPPDDVLHPVWRRPYRIHRDNVMRSGNSGVIEVPASGHLLEFAKGEDEELVWEFFEHHIVKRFKMRWEKRQEVAVDIFEIFWHPCELIMNRTSGKLNTPILERFREFLLEIITREGVSFSTVYDAAMDWKCKAEPHLSI